MKYSYKTWEKKYIKNKEEIANLKIENAQLRKELNKQMRKYQQFVQMF